MENKSPFDLNRALRARLDELAQTASLHADDLEELEHHLRDSVAKLQSGGQSLEEAFARATVNLGGSALVAGEFWKVNPMRVWPARILCMVAGVMLFFVLPKLCDTFAGIVVGMLWRLPINGHVLGLLALVLKWSPLLVVILVVGWWMRARGDSWARAVGACFQRPMLTVCCLILFSIAMTIFLSWLGGFFTSPFSWAGGWANFSQADFARLSKVQMWTPGAAFITPGLPLEHWLRASFYVMPALLIVLAIVKWRGALSRPGTAGIWSPRVLWLLMGAAIVYSVLNLGSVWWMDKNQGAAIYPVEVPWFMGDRFPISGSAGSNLVGLIVLLFWWGPLTATLLAMVWLAGAKPETGERAVTLLFRKPILSALCVVASPVISTLVFRPVFTDLAINKERMFEPERVLTVFGWCRYGALIAPVCILVGMIVFLVHRRTIRLARI